MRCPYSTNDVQKISFIVLAGVWLSIPLRAQAATIQVPTDLPTIQAAIGSAADGDTVLVAPGTYVESLNFLGKAITVASEQGPEVTIIDGNRARPVVTFSSTEGSDSVLEGFTVRNGNGNFPFTTGEGGGIRITDTSPTIVASIITANVASKGVELEYSRARR